MNLQTLHNTVEEIIAGHYDGPADAKTVHLDKLSAAIKARKELLTQQASASIKLQLVPNETRVRFIDSTRPKYLAGREATFLGFKQKNVKVRVDEGHGFESGKMIGKTITTPISLIEVI